MACWRSEYFEVFFFFFFFFSSCTREYIDLRLTGTDKKRASAMGTGHKFADPSWRKGEDESYETGDIL